MAESYYISVAASCAAETDGSGVLSGATEYTLPGSGGTTELPSTLDLLDAAGGVVATQAAGRNQFYSFSDLANQAYTLRWYEADSPGNVYATRAATVQCGPAPGALLVLDSVSHTDETAAGSDGTATIQAHGGVAPLTASVVELSLSKAATSGAPTAFAALPAGTVRLRVTDSSSPAQQVEQAVTIAAYTAPVTGCQDEYADNYDPAATTAGACAYTPRWRSAWQLMSVAVAALAGQTKAYVAAKLYVGFRPGHPLAAQRPYGAPLLLRATVGPDGYAVFRLGPYLRPLLGAPDGLGGYRLDLNSATATTSDLYVGYELRRTTGELLEHGYALNAAVPDAQLVTEPAANGSSLPLSPFTKALPVWPGFSEYPVAFVTLDTSAAPRAFGLVASSQPDDFALPIQAMPCPPNPLPVRWLAPGSGYGYWVFQGCPQLGDTVAEGQRFQEATTGESRYSERGLASRTYQASSGNFRGPALAEGLATLWRSPQVWLQPSPGSEWVPVTLDGGQFPVRRLGVLRNEVTVTFTEARPHYAQGQ